MTPFFAFFTFLNAWWIMFFIAIAFSIESRNDNDAVNKPEEGYAAAPKHIYWKKAITIATVLAVLVTASIAVIIRVVAGR